MQIFLKNCIICFKNQMSPIILQKPHIQEKSCFRLFGQKAFGESDFRFLKWLYLLKYLISQLPFWHVERNPWQEEVESETSGKSCPGLLRNFRLCTVLPAVVLESTNGSVHIEMTHNDRFNCFLSSFTVFDSD